MSGNYSFSVEVDSGLKPSGANTFPLLEAKDVLMPDGKRLSEQENSGSGEAPTFDLVEMGLPTVNIGGEFAILQADTTEIMAALDKGAVKFNVNANLAGVMQLTSSMIMSAANINGTYICTAPFDMLEGFAYFLSTVVVMNGVVQVRITPINSIVDSRIEAANATEIDLSAFETNGTIVETYSDGSTKTSTVTFDADGNPTHITDSKGNSVIITW